MSRRRWATNQRRALVQEAREAADGLRDVLGLLAHAAHPDESHVLLENAQSYALDVTNKLAELRLRLED